MTPAFELATFTVRDGEEQALLAERPAMVDALAERFPGLLAAWLVKQDDGTWVDVILWQSRVAAEDAAAHVEEVAQARNWFSHIETSLGLRHADVLHART